MRIQHRSEHRQWGRVLLSAAITAVFGVSSVHAGQCLNGQLRAPVGYYQTPQEEDGGDYDCERVEPHVGSLSLTCLLYTSPSPRDS